MHFPKVAGIASLFVTSAFAAPLQSIEARQPVTVDDLLVGINGYSFGAQHVTALALDLSYVDTDDTNKAERVVAAYEELYTAGQRFSGPYPSSLTDVEQYTLCNAIHTSILASNLFDDTVISHTSSFDSQQKARLISGLQQERSYSADQRHAFAPLLKDTCIGSFIGDKDSADTYYDAAIQALQAS